MKQTFLIILGAEPRLLYRAQERLFHQLQEKRFAHLGPTSWFFKLDDGRPIKMHGSFGDGVHYSRLSMLIEALEKEWAVIWTMNPAVLDRCVFDSQIDLHHRLYMCDAKGEPLHITESDARSIWMGLQAGVQQFSEILRTKGFW